MKLSPQELDQLRAWVNEGLNLSAIQSRLSSELGKSMTYMDLRFLLDDLDLEIKEAPAPAPVGKPKPAPVAAEDDDAFGDDPADLVEEPAAEAPGALGGVEVALDAVHRVGAIVSGSVRFSDGVKARWAIDHTGRLGLEGSPPGYAPPREDILQFQTKLRAILERQGGF